MNSEKIFWLMAIVLAAGFFAFLAFGIGVAPANAAQPQATGNSYAAGLPSGGDTGTTGGQAAQVTNGVQEIQLYVQGSTYYPNPIRVKKGIPVRIVADMGRIPGCSRSIVIPDFGIRKVLSTGDNTIEFTPDKSGTFSFSCSMGMYRGTIVVEEADGSVAAFTGAAPKAASGGSCGASGGGCGCGGGI